VAIIGRRVAPDSTVYVDEAACWDELHDEFDAKWINHGLAFSDEGACTNQAESFAGGLDGARLPDVRRRSDASP
jgi:hypothetical protein